jgi:DNA-binding response OmpR family regulator
MKKLLLIEEETCSRNLFAACLEAEGYEIDVAKDDSIGIQVAQNQSPDLVICSLTISSFKETLSGFRQDALMIDVPFILLSATLTQAEIPQYRGKTQDSYLAKPTTVDELLDAIAIQLERQVENHSLSQNYSGFSSDGSDDLICCEMSTT